MTREKIAKARELRAQGLTLKQIAAQLGVSTPTVHRWTAPGGIERDRSRTAAWKERNRPECASCGQLARDYTSTECVACYRARQHREARWTRDSIVAAMRAWATEHGRQPRAHPDWTAGGPNHPPSSTVLRVFGSWDAAIEEAGFESLSRYVGVDPSEVVRLYADEGLSGAAVARRLGCSEPTVWWHLRRRGVSSRSLRDAQRLRHEKAAA